MAEANLFVVYSPLGERFEVTAPNFRDLTTHAGWTTTPPHPQTVEENRQRLNGTTSTIAVAAASEEEQAGDAEDKTSDAEEAGNGDSEGEEEASKEDERVLKAAPSDFADMDKAMVFEYLEKTFPENTVDGRKGRDALVAIAIDLANAELNG